MKKIKYKSLVVVSLILGMLISIQIKTINSENDGMTTTKKGEELAIDLKNLKKEKEELELEINNMKNFIEEYKLDKGDKKLKDEVHKYEVLAGYTDVSGEGIEIKISQNKNISQENDILYNYDLLLSMINKLNSAQANAISINGERIVFNTYMNLKEDSLYINDTKIELPITIKAIGNKDTLSSAILIKYGIVWEMEKYYNVSVEVNKKDNLQIRKYKKIAKIAKN